jgi:hypothetical protein
VTEKSKHPKQKAKVFNLSWETDAEPEDAGEETREAGSGEDDFEGHASGFNRPGEA